MSIQCKTFILTRLILLIGKSLTHGVGSISLILIVSTGANAETGLLAGNTTKRGDETKETRQYQLKDSYTRDGHLVANSQEIPAVITEVRVEATDSGVKLVLASQGGEFSSPVLRTVGNAQIVEIFNATIRNDFSQTNPVAGIALIEVTNTTDGRVLIGVTGENSSPEIKTEIGSEFLAVTIRPRTHEESKDAESILVTVIGEQDEGYSPTTASTATKTDTPIRDIPASISVIPRQVLIDQNTLRLQDAVQNVSGVQRQGNYGGTDAGGYLIRGFSQEGNFRNGLPDTDFYSQVDIANIQRIEVLRGPASVLFGQVEPGGIINVVTEQPLTTPYRSIAFNTGSYEFYRPSLDFSGPLTEDGSVLYRLNLAYQNNKSFRDFNFTERIFVAPVITWNINDRTSLVFDVEYLNNKYLFDRGLPSLGNRPAPVPISRLVGLPESKYDDDTLRIGYRLEHQISSNWEFRNAFSYVSGGQEGTYATGGGQLIDDQFSEIFVGRDNFQRDTYTFISEVDGEFMTGSIAHRALVGVELRRNTWHYVSFDAPNPVLLNIFDPDYNVPLPEIPDDKTFSYTTQRDTLGIYFQDQISLTDNLIVLLGGRFDYFKRKEDFGTVERETLNAFNPRIGVVYQPIEAISLYASYSESFQPDRFLGRSATGDPFEPTEGTQYEVGIKAAVNDKLAATLAAYHLTKTNIVTIDSENPLFSVQVGEQRSQGIELDVIGEILPGWNVIASYAYTDAITSKDNEIAVGNRIAGVPENAASFWTTYQIQNGALQGLGFGLGLYYVGNRFADNENTSVLEKYFRVDSAIYYQRENWRISINIRNLFDKTYYETSQSRNIIYPGAPFTILGNISIQF